MYTTDFQKLVMIGAQGKFLTVDMPAEPDYDEEDEDEEDEEYLEEDEDMVEDEEVSPRKGKMKMISALPIVKGNYAVEPILQVLQLGETTQCVSIAEDLRIWDFARGECIMKWDPPEGTELTALASDRAGISVFVGSNRGVLRVMDVTSRSLVRILSMHRVFKKPINCIRMNRDQTLLAVSSRIGKKVFFIRVKLNSELQCIGCSVMKDNVVDMAWNQDRLIVL
jgi:hypothetical protein